MMEDAREKVRNFINAKQAHEVLFTKGTTEGINLIASVLRDIIKAGDEILITGIEHHSNIVPWQMLCERTGAKLKYIPLNENGSLHIGKLDELLPPNTTLVAVNQIFNILVTTNPI